MSDLDRRRPQAGRIADGDLSVDGYDRASGMREQLERTWPDVQLSWQDIPVPASLASMLERWSFSTGYVVTERATSLGTIDPRIRSQEEATIPVELRLGFPAGVGLSYIGTFTDGDGHDPTGRTGQRALTHGVDLTGRFMAPGALRDRFPEPMRVTMAYDYQAQRQCRVASVRPGEACTPFVDFLNRRLNLTLSTLVSQVDLGLQVSYVDRRNFIGIQAGSSELQVGVFGEFNIQAGSF